MISVAGRLTNVHLPLLPFNDVPVNSEADTLGLDNVERFDIFTEFELLLALLLLLRRQVGEEIECFPNGKNE
jgi:hypothetical protein